MKARSKKLFGNKLGFCDCCYHPDGSQDKVRLKTTTYRAGPGDKRTQDLCEVCTRVVKHSKPTGLTRKPVAGSLAAYKADYLELGFTEAPAEALAQLAYGQKQIRRRLEALEAMALASVLGAVEIDTKLHLLSCAKREHKTNACNCGAEP